MFGPHENGTIFVIDRCLNEIYLYSDGSAHKTITNSRAYSITDNTYIYATSSYNYDYYTCARETFDQIQSLMEGRRIAEPMRYICSALLAVILALFVNFFFVMYSSRSRKPDRKDFLSGAYTQVQMQEANAQFDHQTRAYSPKSSSRAEAAAIPEAAVTPEAAVVTPFNNCFLFSKSFRIMIFHHRTRKLSPADAVAVHCNQMPAFLAVCRKCLAIQIRTNDWFIGCQIPAMGGLLW